MLRKVKITNAKPSVWALWNLLVKLKVTVGGDEAHRAFGFWLGEVWITQPDGTH